MGDATGEGGGRQNWRSLPIIPATPAHDKMKELLNKRNLSAKSPDPKMGNLTILNEIGGSTPQLYKRRLSPVSPIPKSNGTSRRSSISQPGVGSSPEEPTSPKSLVDIALRYKGLTKAKRRMSEVVTKITTKLQDRRCHSLESTDTASRDCKRVASSRRHSLTTALEPSASKPADGSVSSGNLNIELLNPPAPFRRNGSQSSGSSYLPSDSEFDDTGISPDRIPPEGDDITSMLGPAQVMPKPSLEKTIQGDIRVGFTISKGQLEVEVVCAKGLTFGATGTPPDTYVKTCLVEGNKRLQRKKTKTVKMSVDPMYRQVIKYSACNIHGRYMQIQIKEKSGGFDKNRCLGEVVVRMDSLDLSSHTSGWYKLFQPDAADINDSNDSLHF